MVINKKGMTLLEVLLAITILSIVLTSFFSLFPQIATFNAKTDEKLSGMYLANEKIVVLNELAKKNREIFSIDPDEQTLTISDYSKANAAYAPLKLAQNMEEYNDFFLLYTDEENIQSKIKINKRPDTAPNDYYQLYRIHVEVFNRQLDEVSSIYGYLSIPKNKE